MAPVPSPPVLTLSAGSISQLAMEPLAPLTQRSLAELLVWSGQVSLGFEWPREADDPRELSEIAELRLWSLRADALNPWLPVLLERSTGQLTRHVAMLLPHGFSRSEGIRFAPESLELWITHRLFLLDDQARRAGLNCRSALAQMAAVLGFELDPGFWDGLPTSPPRQGP